MPDEMVDRGMPFGPKYVDIQQLADQAKSIMPAAKHVKAMKLRGELDATGLILSLEAVRAELLKLQPIERADPRSTGQPDLPERPGPC